AEPEPRAGAAREPVAPAEPAEPAAAAPAAEPAPPTTGLLRIEADVPGAQVFIDRQFIGAAPVTAENITPGTHQLNVSAEGYEGIAMPIDVTAGRREITVRFRDVRLNASIDVVHRHGVGSCRGRLVATPAGIRYETSNRDDAFSTGLLDLETFQVDYLAKNLRVKLPRGRQFNFTDPDGNADRLFVFHRDVERARERLRQGDAPASN
ncbi:MAG: PEGA domain-containing protein, partial [Acidobacteria bacterium]|nr:PEGA domain-containing protein [Acidobacteriota bacterium]